MFSPWEMRPVMPWAAMHPLRAPLLQTAIGAFPVPHSLSPQQFPVAVKESILRLIEGPPKPAVTLAVMDKAQATMIAPDFPFVADV